MQVLRKPKLAELLLPHIFLDLAVFAAEQYDDLQYVLSGKISTLLLRDTTTDTRVISLILTCLDHLHSFNLDTQEGPDIVNKMKSRSASILKEFHHQRQHWPKVSRSISGHSSTH